MDDSVMLKCLLTSMSKQGNSDFECEVKELGDITLGTRRSSPTGVHEWKFCGPAHVCSVARMPFHLHILKSITSTENRNISQSTKMTYTCKLQENDAFN